MLLPVLINTILYYAFSSDITQISEIFMNSSNYSLRLNFTYTSLLAM